MATDKQMTAGAIGGWQGSSNSLGWVVRRGQVGLLRVPLPLHWSDRQEELLRFCSNEKKLRTNFFVTKFLFVREKWFFVFVLLSISSKTFNNFFMKYRKKLLKSSIRSFFCWKKCSNGGQIGAKKTFQKTIFSPFLVGSKKNPILINRLGKKRNSLKTETAFFQLNISTTEIFSPLKTWCRKNIYSCLGCDGLSW